LVHSITLIFVSLALNKTTAYTLQGNAYGANASLNPFKPSVVKWLHFGVFRSILV